MRTFLASIPLDGRRIVVVGHGPLALAKVRLAARTSADLAWFCPQGEPPAGERPLAPFEPRLPTSDDFAGAALVFLALEDEAVVADLAVSARAAGALVNVVDRPALSDFQTPALVARGEVVVGIATGGVAPVLARDIRARVEAALPPGLANLASLARDLRETAKAAIPDFLARRRFWERAVRGRAARLAISGRSLEARREMLRLMSAAQAEPGVVHIVGAGPGDPELLTLKAMRALQDADVIVYDRLVSQAVLDYARRDARLIYAGKASRHHSIPQTEINELLIHEARLGHRVVRLKGGDPFVFGRGGEELDALRQAGVETHVIPGISAALGCAASAGIALTHRDQAQAVTLLTGRPQAGAPPIDWSALAGAAHTLVFYMGATSAEAIAQNLLAAGRAPETPVAVVENGTLGNERVTTGALAGLPELVAAMRIEGPALLFVGETAAGARVQARSVQHEDAA